uniref:Transcription activation suppressor family member 2 n=1 Tax=Molossus molossus TaxID=27622 RepID=A0A7J8K1I9_MOLMO|nr:transcription activation suppressor family member 2 [Molossus molossus]
MSTKLFTKKKKQVTILRKNSKKLTDFFCLKLKVRQSWYVSVDSVLAAVLLPLLVIQEKVYTFPNTQTIFMQDHGIMESLVIL